MTTSLLRNTMLGVVLLAAALVLATTVATAWHNNNNNNHYNNQDRVLLSDVQVLTLSEGKMTAGRRSSPVPQLACVGGSARCDSRATPKSMMCTNVGSDGVDAQWKCEAEVPDGIRLGRTEVLCEGYEYPDDPYILRGSCGVEYTLEGELPRNTNSYTYHSSSYTSSESSGGLFSSILYIAMVAFVIYAFLQVCCASPRAQYAADGTPPPYAPAGGAYGPGYGPGYNNMGYGGPGCAPPPAYYGPRQRGPEFWSGLGLGGMLGSMWNRPRYGYGYGNGYAQPAYRPARSGGFSSSSTTRSTGGSHTSSSYGGTRRR